MVIIIDNYVHQSSNWVVWIVFVLLYRLVSEHFPVLIPTKSTRSFSRTMCQKIQTDIESRCDDLSFNSLWRHDCGLFPKYSSYVFKRYSSLLSSFLISIPIFSVFLLNRQQKHSIFVWMMFDIVLKHLVKFVFLNIINLLEIMLTCGVFEISMLYHNFHRI